MPVTEGSASLPTDKDGLAFAGAVKRSTGDLYAPSLDDDLNLLTKASVQGTMTNRSGTIMAGAGAQSLMVANPDRRYLMIQNLDSTYSLWIRFSGTATQAQPSTELPPGAVLTQETSFVSTEAISIIGPTTGQAFSAWEA